MENQNTGKIDIKKIKSRLIGTKDIQELKT